MSEQKLEVFNVLNFLNSGYELDDILNQGNFGTFPSAEDCINYLVENGYLAGEGESVTIGVTVEKRASPLILPLEKREYNLIYMLPEKKNLHFVRKTI